MKEGVNDGQDSGGHDGRTTDRLGSRNEYVKNFGDQIKPMDESEVLSS